jgi:23S rRNA (cytidine2498-2'-O)-methyltransferase
MPYIVATSQREAMGASLSEIQAADGNARLIKRLGTESSLISVSDEFEKLIDTPPPDNAPLRRRIPFIFTRRIFLNVESCDGGSFHAGEREYKKDDNFISRAEFKLLEAFEAFGIDPAADENPLALDLGAAPGGWTKVLLSSGCSVVAVDPAKLHSQLYENKNLTHLEIPAQRLPEGIGPFSLIVNDMRMDVYDSCRIMLDMVEKLEDNGIALMTLKLSSGDWRRKTLKALDFLESRYRVIDAKQLFYNRGEVTVCMKKNNA